mmetsp:Transcript_5043/g.4618  ORF Transcript_5043/g.4618 Transcript_5043/m.4618 type:complete len:87 (-) Transcript_5043:63-323(-)
MMSLVLLIALTTHALFEGIALGLTATMQATLNIMLGLLFHKVPSSISLGISLSKAFCLEHEQRKALFLTVVFASATPIGIATGMII